jgi:tetratricopeptide (TPR) repeat protein
MNIRTRTVVICLLMCIILPACGPSQAEKDSTATQAVIDNIATQTANAPTSTATYTPSPTATNTPKPTLTPTPTTTATPTPTKNPLAGDFVDGKLVIKDERFDQLTDIGQRLYSDGYYLFESVIYEAMQEYSLKSDQLITIYSLQHEDYESLGHYNLAIKDLLKILDLGDRRAGFLNGLCWDYAITKQATQALPYCEEAVKNDPSSMTLDSRGVTYALLGRYPEAVSDFEAALEQDDFPNEDMKAERQEWVTSLKAGNNPITEEVLAQERGEESSIAYESWFTGDLTLSYLRTQYEDMGYVFKETTIDGQPAITSTIQDGKCKVDLVLSGDDQGIKGATSKISGCSHDDIDSHAWDFIYPFSRDLNEMAHALVWKTADVYYVIEGKPVTDLNPTIGGFQFSAARTNAGDNEGIIVAVKPVK